MLKSFQVLFCIKLEKVGIPIDIQMSCTSFVLFVLSNVKKSVVCREKF
jgi:hypothetical protein